MGLESRPYVGTWRLNGKSLVQVTPDALVYLNGDTSLPGCSKCNGKIDIQRFITEVSVDAGTLPGSASASFSLSVPLHHTESFARDAKFLLRPGLEVHVYMRGYFPIAGLYAPLAEAQVQGGIAGSTAVSPTPQIDDVNTRDVPAPELVQGDTDFAHRNRRGPPTSIIIHESGSNSVERTESTFRANGSSVHYMVGKDGVRKYFDPVTVITNHTPDHNNNSVGIEFNHAYYGQGEQIDAPWFHTGKYTVPPQNQCESMWETTVYVSGETGININFTNVTKDADGNDVFDFSAGASDGVTGVSSHRSTKGNHTDGTFPLLYMAVRDRGYSGQSAYAAAIRIAREANTRNAKVALPDPIETLATPGIVLEPGTTATTAQVSPSFLEQMGLDGLGLEDTLSYPYYHVFHGVVKSVSHSYSGGVNTISVSCGSMLHFWEYHNMSTNASAFGARPTNSKLKMSLVGNNFSGMHPYQILYTLHHDMAGAAGGVAWALSSKSNQTAVTEVGDETLYSLNIKYWEKRFQGRTVKLRMHGATGDLFSTMAAAWLGKTSSASLMSLMRNRFNVQDLTGSAKAVYQQSVAVGMGNANRRKGLAATSYADRTAGRGASNKAVNELNVVEMQAFVKDLGLIGQVNMFESTYQSKLDIAQKVVEVTGFEFYQDVDGDFVFKPPMWNLDTSSSRVYRIEDIDIINISFTENEPQVTYMTCKGSHFKGVAGSGLENEWGVRGQYIDYRLVAQFGWRPGTLETAYLNDAKSMFFAAVNRMDVMNIGINSASVTIPIRPEIRPGYPVYIPYLDCFYYCNSFSHAHAVGGQCTTSLQLVGKRAKFYAPGIQTSAGVEDIKMGNMILPPRPLTTVGQDGNMRLVGFPNVVMALDPNAINPMFFVVGSDLENFASVDVLRSLLEMGVTLKVLKPVQVKKAGGTVYMMDSGYKDGAGEEAKPYRVAFYFQEGDLGVGAETPEEARKAVAENTLVNVLQAGAQLKAATESAEADAVLDDLALKRLRFNILALQSELETLKTTPTRYSEPVAYDKKRDEFAARIRNAEVAFKNKTSQINTKNQRIQNSWRDTNDPEMHGVAFLFLLRSEVGRMYRSGINFQGRGDLSSSVSLLDMLSDKKATFSDGTQPGNYRYYSCSHPKVEEQAPKFIAYDTKTPGKVVVSEQSIIALEDRRPIKQFDTYPQAPFPGAEIPEAAFKEATPTVGIRVLDSSGEAGGRAYATSDIMELMFSVQPVDTTTAATSSVRAMNHGSLGESALPKIINIFKATPKLTDTPKTLFGDKWDWMVKQLDQATAAAGYTMDEMGITTITTVDGGVLPSHLQVFSASIPITEEFGKYTYSGSEGKKSLGRAKASATEVGTSAATSLAKHFVKYIGAVRKNIVDWIRVDGGSSGAGITQVGPQIDKVIGVFNNTFGSSIGVNLSAATRLFQREIKGGSDTTFSPVFPVSDAQGYEVVGSYRYGRGVSIEPQGAFEQLHKKDIFSMVDKKTVEKVLRFFVLGTPGVKTYAAEDMETVTVGGKQVTRPKAGANLQVQPDSETARYLNEEVIRQLRDSNLTDKQILDYGFLLEGREPTLLDFSLANVFADQKLDGVQKIPVINAAYSLADLNIQQTGHICNCKAAEADVHIAAFGQEHFLQFTPAGVSGREGYGSAVQDAGTRWLASTTAQAASQWEQQQQALRGQVLEGPRPSIIKAIEGVGDQIQENINQAKANYEADRQQIEDGLDDG